MSKTDQIEQKLEELKNELLPLGVAGVRMDYMVTDNGTSRRIMVLDRHGAGARFALVSKRAPIREKGVRSLVNNLPIEADQANRILDLAEELSELNDMGAWPFETTPRESAVADNTGVDGNGYGALPGFKRRFNNLRDCLPNIQRIRIDEHQGKSTKGSNTRKAWASFYSFDGEQVASIAINHLRTMLRDWYGTDADAQPTADANCGRWANQLGISLNDFMDVAMDLMSFDGYLQVTDIYLDYEA